MSAEGRSFSVTAESLAQLVGGLASREEALLRQVLALFPVPRPEHAAQLMAAIHRIGASVRWFEKASGFTGVDFHAKLSRDFHPKLSHPVAG